MLFVRPSLFLQTPRPASALTRLFVLAALVALVAPLSACSPDKGRERPAPDSQDTNQGQARTGAPSDSAPSDSSPSDVATALGRQGHTIAAGPLDLPSAVFDHERIDVGNASFVEVQPIGGIAHIRIQGIADAASFARLQQLARARASGEAAFSRAMHQGLTSTIHKIDAAVPLLQKHVDSDLGYFSALVALDRVPELRSLRELPLTMVISPVIHTDWKQAVRRVPGETIEALRAAKFDGRSTLDGFSGLKPMHVPEFIALIEDELGATPDGSLVKLGIADSGVTYGHPTFADAEGNSRVTHMRDFTSEGRVYFNPTAKFEISLPEAARDVSGEGYRTLILNAQFLAQAVGGIQLPKGDAFRDMRDVAITVPTALGEILLQPGSGAKLGVFSEKAYGEDSVDINLNGKSDDTFFMILLPQGTDTAPAYRVYMSLAGTADFRRATPTGDFNLSGDTITLGSETFGFDIRPTELPGNPAEGDPGAKPGKIKVIGVSVVGFDPGNHGSHVSGIAAGGKIIANDRDDTLARGVAPAAQLMVNRICANQTGCGESEAIIDLAKAGAEIINMSIGGLSALNDGLQSGAILIDRLTSKYNTLFVVSAGNSGPGHNTVGSPSTSRLALSVGATASRSMIERQYQNHGESGPTPAGEDISEGDPDFVLGFSSRGPAGSGGFKPNIMAPGTELSAVQLNTVAGARGGLDVYWGTSMAAPSASGAITLLVDAAKRYNASIDWTRDNPIPLDAMTLRKAIIASARPFDAKLFDTATGTKTEGQYSWIDQGTGMIDLVAAWSALKAEANSEVPSAVTYEENGHTVEVELDYKIRLLNVNPNGTKYDGTDPVDASKPKGDKRLAEGVWLSPLDDKNQFGIQVVRAIPDLFHEHPAYGELRKQLLTTMDQFEFDLTIYGSHMEWLKVGTLDALGSCMESPTSDLTVLGEGAVDHGSNTREFRASTLYICVDRKLTALLEPGDHGALIRAYRKNDDAREPLPSYIVPVYMNVPHSVLAGGASYEIRGSVAGFEVDRNYVRIPKGTSMVKVTASVPEDNDAQDTVKGCSGVQIVVHEGANIKAPPEFRADRSKAYIANCDRHGTQDLKKREVSYIRFNPNPGIWDVHIKGRPAYHNSDYELKLTFANVTMSIEEIKGGASVLTGSLTYEILDASLDAEPVTEHSEMILGALAQTVEAVVTKGQTIDVPNKAGETHRVFPEEVKKVTFATGGAPKADLDLYVFVCEPTETSAEKCEPVGRSASPTDVEAVTFEPKQGVYYVAKVEGYSVPEQGGAKFAFTETRAPCHHRCWDCRSRSWKGDGREF